MKKMLIKSRVMDFVTGKGEARYTDIIKFIVEDIHGMTYNKTLHRGYYSCALSSYNPYFLHPSNNEPRHLVKNKETKKYRVVSRNEALKLMKEEKDKKLENKNFMVKECRDFIDSLYPKNREWKDNEILDVLVYYSEHGFLIKYHNDLVLVFERDGRHIKSFARYEDFVNHIGGNEK